MISLPPANEGWGKVIFSQVLSIGVGVGFLACTGKGGWLPSTHWELGFASQHALGMGAGGWLRVVRILLECFLVSIALMNIYFPAVTCEPGYGGNGTVCEPCAKGFYKPLDGNTDCISCPENNHRDNRDNL